MAARGGAHSLRRPSKIRRGITLFANAFPSIGGFLVGLWKGKGNNRWLAPLVVFLCLAGLLLIAATSVEALAPFIYTIF